jgi:hypothetical protein
LWSFQLADKVHLKSRLTKGDFIKIIIMTCQELRKKCLKLENNFCFQKKKEKNDATDDEALSWKEILDSNIEEATTKKQKPKLKKEKEVSEDAVTSTITRSGKQTNKS